MVPESSRPSETVQLEADLGAMLAAVRSPPQLAEEADVTMEDAAEVDTVQLLAALGLDDAALAPALAPLLSPAALPKCVGSPLLSELGLKR